MKAYVLTQIGKLEYKDITQPKCEKDWALVKVKASGICSSDIARIFIKGTYHFPTIPGHEFSGIVVAVGSKKDNCLVGKRVGIFPLIPCKTCNECANKNYEMCHSYDYLGSRRDGGFAEYVAVPVWNLVELSEKISFEEAAMMEPLAVARHAVQKGNVKEGDYVAVVGTGMIGFAAAQWARYFGANKVIVYGRNSDKRKFIKFFDGIEYRMVQNGFKEEFDVVIEAVGSIQAIVTAIQLVRSGGRVVLMGNPSGDILIKQDVYWKILRKQLNVVGTWNSSYKIDNISDWEATKEALEKKMLNVKDFVSHKIKQDNLMSGLQLMKNHKETYCKIMTIWGEK